MMRSKQVILTQRDRWDGDSEEQRTAFVLGLILEALIDLRDVTAVKHNYAGEDVERFEQALEAEEARKKGEENVQR